LDILLNFKYVFIENWTVKSFFFHYLVIKQYCVTSIRQECTLSPLIFNAYIQEAIDTIRDKTQLGIKINVYKLDMLRFINNIAINAVSKKDLKKHF